MSKVTRPLFGDQASGSIAGLGYFRQGRNGPEFNPLPDPTTRKPTPPRPINTGFRLARAEWATIPKTKVKRNGRWVWRILPPWGTFWPDWLTHHPEYRS